MSVTATRPSDVIGDNGRVVRSYAPQDSRGVVKRVDVGPLVDSGVRSRVDSVKPSGLLSRKLTVASILEGDS